MLDHDPRLVYASWDWGGGDWETGLGGASHVGSKKMARFLLEKGARIDAFCAAMLGEKDVIAAMVAADSAVVNARGPHGYCLLYHAAISGDTVFVTATVSGSTATAASVVDVTAVKAGRASFGQGTWPPTGSR